MDKDLGSLEAGKLADILILDKNPMENIQNSESIKFVMMNGHLYDAETLTEKGKQASKFWWQNEKYAGFGYHEAGETHHQGHCSCGK